MPRAPDERGAELEQVIPSTSAQNAFSQRDKLIELTRQRTANFGARDRPNRRSVPLIITTDEFAAEGRYILFWAGLGNASWMFKLRGSEQLTPHGTVAHFWRDAIRGTYFDEPVINFKFQTGNLLPIRVDDSGELQTLPPGLLDYYDFFDILDSKKSFMDGTPNFVRILYSSLLYPQIILSGFFVADNSFTVTEETTSPASVSWDIEFRVRDTSPRFNSGRALANEWYNNIVNTPIIDAFSNEFEGLPQSNQDSEFNDGVPFDSGPERGPMV